MIYMNIWYTLYNIIFRFGQSQSSGTDEVLSGEVPQPDPQRDQWDTQADYWQSYNQLWVDLLSAIISNTKAINESVGTLQKFETFMNNLISTNDNLLQSDRFMLKIIRLKFELETCLKSLRDILTSWPNPLIISVTGTTSWYWQK